MENDLKRTYWKGFIKAWKALINKDFDLVYIKHPTKENDCISIRAIEEKSIKYYEKLKGDFQVQIELSINLLEAYLTEYIRANKTFKKWGKSIVALPNPLDFHFESPIKGSFKVHFRYSSMPAGSNPVFDLDDLQQSEKANPIFNYGEDEVIPCVVGLCYYCSYLFKEIHKLDSQQIQVEIENVTQSNTEFKAVQKVNSKPIQSESENVIANNTDNLRDSLSKYGFFRLEKVKFLSGDGQVNLIELLSKNKVPYRIAMLDYLGFISHIETEYSQNKNETYAELAKIINASKRSIKGNILVLIKHSKENRKRYTAHNRIEKVMADYYICCKL